MKRLLLIISTALLLCACAKTESSPAASDPAPAPETSAPEPEKTEEITVTAEPEVTAEPSPETKPVSPAENAMEYLSGTWMIETNDKATNGSVSLTFDAAEGTVRIENQDQEYVTASVSQFDPYPDHPIGTNGALRFEASEASDRFTSSFGTNMNIFSSDMQWFTGTYRDNDYLFLRELGNGMSVIDSELLKESNMAGDFGWVFVRPSIRSKAEVTDNETLKRKGGSYYALCWRTDGKAYLLQPMDTLETIENWYGEDLNTLLLGYDESETRFDLCLYDGTELPRFVDFGLLYVTLDDAGSITGVKEVRYMGYGAYEGQQ